MSYPKIKHLTSTAINDSFYAAKHVGCIILTADRKILLQQRPDNWQTFPGCLATFGGQIETDEAPEHALVRELHEELGARVDLNEIVYLGAITEKETNHTILLHTYFWHDRANTITGCYEGDAAYFADRSQALHHPKVMDDVVWCLQICAERKLI